MGGADGRFSREAVRLVVDRLSDADILTHLVRGLDGVVDVDSTVNYRWNDRDLALSRELHVS
jgi:hypothetical protein